MHHRTRSTCPRRSTLNLNPTIQLLLCQYYYYYYYSSVDVHANQRTSLLVADHLRKNVFTVRRIIIGVYIRLNLINAAVGVCVCVMRHRAV